MFSCFFQPMRDKHLSFAMHVILQSFKKGFDKNSPQMRNIGSCSKCSSLCHSLCPSPDHWPTGAPVQQRGAGCGTTPAGGGRSSASWAVGGGSRWQHTRCWQNCPEPWSTPRPGYCYRRSQEALKEKENVSVSSWRTWDITCNVYWKNNLK